MIRSTANTYFDFDAPRVNGDGTATITMRCIVGDVLWGQKDISMTREQVASVIDAPVTAGLSRRADVYVAFGEWLMREGVIAGTFVSSDWQPLPITPAPEEPPATPLPPDPPIPAQLPELPEAPYEVPVVQGEPEVSDETGDEAVKAEAQE